jgi:transcriptional regulator with XRE-family HTH domain
MALPDDVARLGDWMWGRNKMKSFGALVAHRRRELGLTQTELGARIKGRSGQPVSQKRITDIEHDRFGVPRAPVLKQIARALKLDLDVLYLWGARFRRTFARKGLPKKRSRRPGALFGRWSGARIHEGAVDERNTVMLAVFASLHWFGPRGRGAARPGEAAYEALCGSTPAGIRGGGGSG